MTLDQWRFGTGGGHVQKHGKIIEEGGHIIEIQDVNTMREGDVERCANEKEAYDKSEML